MLVGSGNPMRQMMTSVELGEAQVSFFEHFAEVDVLGLSPQTQAALAKQDLLNNLSSLTFFEA